MNPTQQQIDIHAAMSGTKDNIMINAVAGSGKTTTVVQGAQKLPRSTGFLSFNKKIAVELQSRLPNGMVASTFNALGHQFLRSRMSTNMKLNQYKSYDLMGKHVNIDFGDEKHLVVKLVSAAKAMGVGLLVSDQYSTWEDLAYMYDITPGEESGITMEMLIDAAQKVFHKNEDDYTVIDFDDQLYLSLKFMMERGWKPHQRFPILIIDEAQDTSAVQAELLAGFSDRQIMVGDKFQAIYGFRGAGVDSMGHLKEYFNPMSFDLSCTFRCAKSIVALAQTVNPAIEPMLGAPEGEITRDRKVHEVWHYAQNGDLVICRNNFPLIGVALTMLREGRPFNMSGNYPQQLIAFVKRFNATNIQQFRVRLQDWWDTVSTELKEKNRLGALEREEDKFKSLFQLQAESTGIDDLIGKLEYMVKNVDGPCLSSIHASKGLEANVVHFVDPDLIPSKYASQEWQLQQEDNLFYVGVTRAKTQLHFYYAEK